jgi:hypothetical protein
VPAVWQLGKAERAERGEVGGFPGADEESGGFHPRQGLVQGAVGDQGRAGVGAIGNGLGQLDALEAQRPVAAQRKAGVEDVDLEQQEGA